MFTGFRNVPHFVVAASKKDPYSNSTGCSGRIDTETLDRFRPWPTPRPLRTSFHQRQRHVAKRFLFHGGAMEDFQLTRKPKQNDIPFSINAR